jgi:adenosylmethionine-8-amino-7-oxononanoate aminotransferase
MNVVFEKAIAQGVMIRTMENTIILSPPLIVEEEHVDQILQALDGALTAAAG